jgi:hypothetical protein
MIWRELLKEGLAERHRTSPQELDGLRGVVRRNLSDAGVPSISADTRFACAYEAALTLAMMAIAPRQVSSLSMCFFETVTCPGACDVRERNARLVSLVSDGR